jgi:hypothetical protein
MIDYHKCRGTYDRPDQPSLTHMATWSAQSNMPPQSYSQPLRTFRLDLNSVQTEDGSPLVNMSAYWDEVGTWSTRRSPTATCSQSEVKVNLNVFGLMTVHPVGRWNCPSRMDWNWWHATVQWQGFHSWHLLYGRCSFPRPMSLAMKECRRQFTVGVPLFTVLRPFVFYSPQALRRLQSSGPSLCTGDCAQLCHLPRQQDWTSSSCRPALAPADSIYGVGWYLDGFHRRVSKGRWQISGAHDGRSVLQVQPLHCFGSPLAASVAKAFFDEIVKLHGLPCSIVSDCDTVFTSLFWTELFSMVGVKLQMSSAFHPQSDGQLKVVNRIITMYLRYLAGDRPKSWLKWLPWAEFCYNSSYQMVSLQSLRQPPFPHGFLPARGLACSGYWQTASGQEWISCWDKRSPHSNSGYNEKLSRQASPGGGIQHWGLGMSSVTTMNCCGGHHNSPLQTGT